MNPKCPMTFNWPLLSPRRPRSPSSFCSSSAFSSRVPSFSSDITEFYDAPEDWSENMEQATYCHEISVWDYLNPMLSTRDKIFGSPNLKAFTFEELKRVIGIFHHDRVIGEGGFGHVYKGWIDEQTFTPSRPGSSMAIAVKIWNQKSLKGHAEWQAEVYYLGQLCHPNVVKLIGFCSEDDHLALVYEYVQRGSLDNHLFKGDHPLSWTLRLKVAIGVAKGFSFLHDAERPIIFRDVKSSNVLLDAEFNAKLADFGLAIAGPTEDETYIETAVMGTYGYAAPEYVATGNLYVKSDVYGFGVVLFELLSGLRAIDVTRPHTKQILVDWALDRTRSHAKQNLMNRTKHYLGYTRKLTKFMNPKLEGQYPSDYKRKLVEFMDPKLKGQYPKEGANKVAKIALQCVRNDPELRPHMSEVLTALEGLQHWDGPICPSCWLSPNA